MVHRPDLCRNTRFSSTLKGEATTHASTYILRCSCDTMTLLIPFTIEKLRLVEIDLKHCHEGRLPILHLENRHTAWPAFQHSTSQPLVLFYIDMSFKQVADMPRRKLQRTTSPAQVRGFVFLLESGIVLLSTMSTLYSKI